jgi:hypothetical protein
MALSRRQRPPSTGILRRGKGKVNPPTLMEALSAARLLPGMHNSGDIILGTHHLIPGEKGIK